MVNYSRTGIILTNLVASAIWEPKCQSWLKWGTWKAGRESTLTVFQ